MSSRSKKFVLPATSLAGFVAIGGGLVVADPIGHNVGQTEDTGAKPDGGSHSLCVRVGTPTDVRDAAVNSLTTTGNNSDLTASILTACTAGNSTWRDVTVLNINLPSGYGSAPCVSQPGPGPGVECNRYEARIDRAAIVNDTPAANEATGIYKTVCHELGHTMGLTHYKDADDDFPDAPDGQPDCMISGVVPDNAGHWTVNSDHHKAHINWEF